MRRFFILLSILLLSLPMALPMALPTAHAMNIYTDDDLDTNIRITVLAQDAVFIGTEIGGAHVKVIDKRTGDVLAEGITYGGSGVQDTIMSESRKRDAVLVDDDTASFDFSLSLLEPTAVIISATGPLAQPQAMVTTTQDYVLVPGKDYSSGNGIMLELSGITVDILAPAAHQKIIHNPDEPITLLANIIKLSGSNIEKDSPWPPERYEVQAFIYKESALFAVAPLNYLGNSQFGGKLKLPEAGTFRIVISSFDPHTKEAGMDVTTIIAVAAEQKQEQK